MKQYLRSLLMLFACLMSACVFISEPDVGASGTGPEFGDDYETDDTRSPPGTSPDPSNMNQESGGGEPGTSNALNQDAGTSMPEDAFISTSEDAEALPDNDGSINDGDGAIESPADGGTSIVDMDVGSMNDAQIEPTREDCTDVEWDCGPNGYCDPERRPECALTPGAPACYGFQTMDDTDPEAYARCCAEAGECNRGNFCEPEASEYDYCWLISPSPSCYIGPNPISDWICN